MNQSPRFTLNSVDWKSIEIGALKAMLGALLTYLTGVITKMNFGFTPILVFGWSLIANIGWKYVDGPTATH